MIITFHLPLVFVIIFQLIEFKLQIFFFHYKTAANKNKTKHSVKTESLRVKWVWAEGLTLLYIKPNDNVFKWLVGETQRGIRWFRKVLDFMSAYVSSARHGHLGAAHSSRPALIFMGWGRAELQQSGDSFCSFEMQMTREQTFMETTITYQWIDDRRKNNI